MEVTCHEIGIGVNDLKNNGGGELILAHLVVLCNQRDRGWMVRPSATLSGGILAVHGDTAQTCRAVEMGGKPFLHSSRCRLQLTSELRARTVVSRTLSVPGAASVH